MIRNYLAILIRGFRKKPLYSVLNIAGLAMGIACAAFIFLWVEDENGYDHQYPKHDRLYSIRMNLEYLGKIESYNNTPWRLTEAIRPAIPEITNLTRVSFERDLFHTAAKSTYEPGLCVDTGFFSMLQPVFLKGNAAAFTNLHTLILTARMAAKFFGTAEPVGKTLRVNNEQDYTVIGIVKDPPASVSLTYEWLAPIQTLYEANQWLSSWSNYAINTLVELRPGADADRISSQITTILRPKDRLYTKASCMLWPMNDWHVHDQFANGHPEGGRIIFINIITSIAWIVILIACINFMNLATARAGRRALEVGVRKTLGAMRRSLILQFILESFVMSFVAVILAVYLVYIFMPVFNTLVDKQLNVEPFEGMHLAALMGIGVFCGLIAGSYPAFYLSSFDPAAALKGQLMGPSGGAGLIRKGLVVLQFTFSVGLIVCTVILYRQLQYLKARDLGYDKAHLLYAGIDGDMAGHFNALRTDLLRTGQVADAAMSRSAPLEIWNNITSDQLTWPDAGPGKKVQIFYESVSPEYFSTMGLQLKQGRNFYADIKADSGDIIINETLAAIIGNAAHIGGFVTYNHQYALRIVGIVKDYLFDNVRDGVAPLLLTCNPERKGNYDFLEVRLKPGIDLSTGLAKTVDLLKRYNPGYPVDYQFVDQHFAEIFICETRISRFAGIFSALTILISCLGLFGLAAYTTERRTKEIGIRKVLGASTAGLVRLLSKEYLQLVTLSCLIGFPLAWLFTEHWSQTHTYRAPVHWWIFALTGATAIGIALLTVSFLAIRAAMANPVTTLRTE
jgi:putative ABC transport system permease protein